MIPLSDCVIYATHGHKFSPDNPPPLNDGDILLNGHTHIPADADMGKFRYLNPGSVSIPKNGSPNGYMTLENGEFLWKKLENGEIYTPQEKKVL